MKRISFGLFLVLSVCLMACTPTHVVTTNQQPSIATQAVVAPGLDLQALIGIAKTIQTAEQFEATINNPASGLNNLDVDNDGQIDYVRVVEYANGGTRGFQLFAIGSTAQNEVQVADMQIQQSASYAQVHIVGNPSIYGSTGVYVNRYPLAEYILFSSLFVPTHRVYVSPYRYNSLPRTYVRRQVTTVTRSTTRTVQSSPRVGQAPIQQPLNRQTQTAQQPLRPAPAIPPSQRNTLQNPNDSQKSFGIRDANRPVPTAGFGKPIQPQAPPMASRPAPPVRSSPPPASRPAPPIRPSGKRG